jgi:predicted nucleotidyltransferase
MLKRDAAIDEHIRVAGFSYPDSVIHSFVGGSALHGAKISQTDDLDIYGVFIEPPQESLGITRLEHFVWSTAGNERRNGPDDVDICLYSLRKWATLAAKGNPTALHFLFVDTGGAADSKQTRAWREVLKNRELFVSRKAALAFQGFANDQLARLVGSKGAGKHGQRPEYICKFGYDAKAAMHVIRLLNEGIEFIRRGTITLPRPEKDLLIKIRTGEYGSLEKLTDLANRLFAELDAAREASAFPDDVDRGKINSLIADVYLTFYIAG